jgi:BlaI family penicillinase repressor
MGPARKTTQRLTPLELRIMKVLWNMAPANVQAVQEALPGERLAYTTVQTMLNLMVRKKYVKRVLKGKAFEYEPLLSQDSATSQAIEDLVDRLFEGSVEGLVMSLVKTRQLDPKKLQRLSALIEEHRKGERKK